MPSAPTDISVSYVVGRALCLAVQWGLPNNTGLGPGSTLEPITQYVLRTSSISPDVVLPPNQTYYLVCGLTAGTNYTFTATAGNVAGRGSGANISQIAIGKRFIEASDGLSFCMLFHPCLTELLIPPMATR